MIPRYCMWQSLRVLCPGPTRPVHPGCDIRQVHPAWNISNQRDAADSHASWVLNSFDMMTSISKGCDTDVTLTEFLGSIFSTARGDASDSGSQLPWWSGSKNRSSRAPNKGGKTIVTGTSDKFLRFVCSPKPFWDAPQPLGHPSTHIHSNLTARCWEDLLRYLQKIAGQCEEEARCSSCSRMLSGGRSSLPW